ncbi:hypothetical protein [Gordonia rhizosphera]|nr:hypothetical protein [Gordonia rhizosphera]
MSLTNTGKDVAEELHHDVWHSDGGVGNAEHLNRNASLRAFVSMRNQRK